jgi:hypothetical protein
VKALFLISFLNLFIVYFPKDMRLYV